VQDKPTETAKLIVGLGNPGGRYEKTRHNVGFRVVERLADRWKACGRFAHDGVLYDVRMDRAGRTAQRALLLKPHTFMNRSGQAVASVVRYYRLASEDVLVVLDDIALPSGKLRLRMSGSAGGHKGLSDVIDALGVEAVPRLRIGVDSPPDFMAAEDYVLGKFSADEQALIERAVELAADAAEDWLFDNPSEVMEKYNRTANRQAGNG